LNTDVLNATIDTRPKSFGIRFRGDGKFLTELGWRSLGYVRKGTNVHPDVELEDPDKGERWMTYQLQLSVGEKIYGLGERFGPFVKNGQVKTAPQAIVPRLMRSFKSVDLWNGDGGTSSDMAYKNVPFYLTSNNYGIFIPSPSLVSYEIQSERTTRVNIMVPGESISMMLIYGRTPAEIIEKYGAITGKPALVPSWTFGLWLTTSFLTNYDEKTVNGFLDGMKERFI
jgi:alpha-D-xyloside xylohydrolase